MAHIEQRNLFGDPQYPHAAAYRKHSDTSFEAAQDVDTKKLQALVLEQLAKWPMTADECADELCIDKLSIRPRFSELKKKGRIEDTGDRVRNKSGKRAAVYRLAK